MSTPRKDIDEVRVAIIGAGVAGCYTAFRLTESNSRIREGVFTARDFPLNGDQVALFEQSNRIGGRLQSIKCGNTYAELGGMRFLHHPSILTHLLQHVQLASAIQDFEMDSTENFTYLKGKKVPFIDLKKCQLPYYLQENEKQKSATELIELVIARYLPNFSNLRYEYHTLLNEHRLKQATKIATQYEQLKAQLKIDGDPFASFSWYEFLQKGLSEEAIQFIQESGGYEIKESTGSAACWLDNLFLTPVTNSLKCLSSGFESLPKRLFELFLHNEGAVHFNHRLKSFSKYSDKYLLEFDHLGTTKKVIAKFLILAIPKPALEKLEPNNFFLTKINSVKFNSIKGIDAFKLFLTYPSDWWKKTGIVKGRCTTDLPLRQFYHYPLKADEKGKTTALTMAAYCNGEDVHYWYALIDSCRLPKLSSKEQEDLIIKKLKRTAHYLLMEAHGVEDAPAPIDAFYKCWKASEGQAGWHVWKKDFIPEKIIPYMHQAVSSENIFITGECWAKEPGSVQGALEVSESILQTKFGLTAPSWLHSEIEVVKKNHQECLEKKQLPT